jgi:two-component system response regulator HydG
MELNPTVFVVDDDEGMRRSVERILISQDLAVRSYASPRDALDGYRHETAALFVTDLRLPEMDGIQLMKAVHALGGHPEFVIITGHGTVETAVEAMRLGAYDYIEKPFDRAVLIKVVRKALERHRLVSENRALRRRLEADAESGLVTHNAHMRLILELIQQVAPTTATVLIQGESGTGKELIARRIHDTSPRREHPMIKVNCAALPDTLLETELFGHERGAFTDASESHPGKFEQAAGGTLFLDEVSEMSAAMQVKLLRVLQEREFERVGGARTLRVDVRILAATNRNLEEAVNRGEFRQDLFYRLNVINIHLPPLRDRREDIPLLAHTFLNRYAQKNNKSLDGFSSAALDAFYNYDWPGNIRELQNAVERAVILSRGDTVDASDLPERLREPTAGDIGPRTAGERENARSDELGRVALPFGIPLEEVERLYVRETVRRLKGDKKLAADILGVNLRTVYRRLE